MDPASNTNTTTSEITNIGGSTTNLSRIHEMDAPTRDFLHIYLAQDDVPSSSRSPKSKSKPQPESQLPPPKETMVEETKAAETKAEETKAEETKAAETKAEETKAAETKAEETKAEETMVEETKAEVQHSQTPAEHSVAAATTPFHPPENMMYKNRLQEFTQKSSIPLPMYQTTNEGTQHAPRFRSIVWVDGKSYTNQVTFLNRKSAEQDVARLALENLPKVAKDEASPLVLENTMFTKSIMNEYATKLNVAMPTYSTVQIPGMLPFFVSTLVFNGIKYTGDVSRNKKEAEQLAARSAILSILDNTGSETLFEIVKSKSRITAAVKPSTSQVIDAANVAAIVANAGQASDSLDLNMAVAGSEQPIGEASSSRKRRKNKKKANKKARLETPLPVAAAFPVNEMPPCSVAQ